MVAFNTLPTEVLLNIFRRVRAVEQTDKENHVDRFEIDLSKLVETYSRTYGSYFSLWSLCLVCKSLNGPATEVLHGSIEIGRDYIGILAQTAIGESSQLISNVKHVHLIEELIAQTSCYEISKREAHRRIRAFAEDQGFLDLCAEDSTYKKHLPRTEAELALTMLTLTNLQTLLISTSTNRTSRAKPLCRLRLLFELITQRSINGVLLNTKQAAVFHGIKELTLDLAGADLSSTANISGVFLLQGLQKLSLHDLDPKRSPEFEGFFANYAATTTQIRDLTLSNCRLSGRDLRAIASGSQVLGKLVLHMPLRRRFRSQLGALDAQTVMNCLGPVQATLTDLTLYAIGRFEDWGGIYSEETGMPTVPFTAPSRDDYIRAVVDLQRTAVRPCDLSSFTKLDNIAISSFLLLGIVEKIDDIRIPLERLPASLRKLQISSFHLVMTYDSLSQDLGGCVLPSSTISGVSRPDRSSRGRKPWQLSIIISGYYACERLLKRATDIEKVII